jgi:hypothetical protein
VGYCLLEKTEGRKSRDTNPLTQCGSNFELEIQLENCQNLEQILTFVFHNLNSREKNSHYNENDAAPPNLNT